MYTPVKLPIVNPGGEVINYQNLKWRFFCGHVATVNALLLCFRNVCTYSIPYLVTYGMNVTEKKSNTIPRQMKNDKHCRQKWQTMYMRTITSSKNVVLLASSLSAMLSSSEISATQEQNQSAGCNITLGGFHNIPRPSCAFSMTSRTEYVQFPCLPTNTQSSQDCHINWLLFVWKANKLTAWS